VRTKKRFVMKTNLIMSAKSAAALIDELIIAAPEIRGAGICRKLLARLDRFDDRKLKAAIATTSRLERSSRQKRNVMHYTTPTTDDNIDQRVEEWHAIIPSTVPLHEWLGLTWEQYARWGETNKLG
jgi:hypothetical protein